MEEENNAKFERMERAYQELQEKYSKTQDDISRMMEMLTMLIRGKKIAGSSGPKEKPVQTAHENTSLPGITPQMPCPTQPQSVGMYTHPYVPLPVVQTLGPTLVEPYPGANPVMVPDLDDPKEREKLKQVDTQCKYELLEERLRAVEGLNMGGVDASELSLVHGLIIPFKFKTPDFEKYNGTKCPATHLTMYCRKMAAHTDNDKLLIYCFQDSLIGTAAQWYLKLDRTHIQT